MGFCSNLDKNVNQFFDFKPAAYERDIAPLNEAQLRALHKRLHRKMVGIAAGAGLSAGAALPTGGFSLIGTAIAWRRAVVNGQRCDIVKARLREKGWQGNDFGLGDVAWGVVPVGLAAALAPGADHLVDHAATHVATSIAAHHGANHIVTQAAGHVAAQTAGHHGARHFIDRAASHVQHMAGDHGAGVDKTTHAAGERVAEAAGSWAAHTVAEKGVGTATGFAVDKFVDIVLGKLRGPPSSSSSKPYQGPTRPSAVYTRKPAGQPKAPPPSLSLRPAKSSTLPLLNSDLDRDSDSVRPPSLASTWTIQLPIPAVEASWKQSTMMRLAMLLLPATIYSAFGQEACWFTCTSGACLALSSRGKIAISAFVIPALLLLYSNARHLWVVSISLAVLDVIGWGVVAKADFYLLMFLLAFSILAHVGVLDS